MTIGAPAPRLEDRRLLRATGRFVDDVDVAGQLAMRVVRSEVAHARIRSIDTEAARRAPGVVAVLTAHELGDLEVIPLRLDFGIELDPYLQHVLARDRVRYVGEPLAVLVAEDDLPRPRRRRPRASPTSTSFRSCSTPSPRWPTDAPSLWDGRGNEAAVLTKRFGDVEAAFAAADHVVAAELTVGRHTGMPLETRGLVAQWDPGREHLTVWGAALVTHYHRRVLSRLLELPVHRITMRSTDAGGNFGVRGDFFPEDFLVPFLAIRTGRPVKWTEDRAEHLVATNHAREQQHRIEAAFAADGHAARPARRGVAQQGRLHPPHRRRRVGDLGGDAALALPGAGLRGHDPRGHHEQDAGRALPRARALRGHVRARGAVHARGARARPGRGGAAPR